MLEEVVEEAAVVSLATMSALMNSIAVLVGFFVDLSDVAEGTAPLFAFWTELLDFKPDFGSSVDFADVMSCFETSTFSLSFEAEMFATGSAAHLAERNTTRSKQNLILLSRWGLENGPWSN